MRTRNFERKKTCPRCEIKLPESVEVCPDCGLVFARLDIATNKDAKRKKKRGDRSFILKTTKIPSDVSYVKLLLLTIFTGLFGGHCFYVGRYLRGSVLLANFLVVLCVAIFNAQLIAYSEVLVSTVCTICGFVMLLWFWDIFMVALKKFKIPVAIDLQNDDYLKDTKQEEN